MLLKLPNVFLIILSLYVIKVENIVKKPPPPNAAVRSTPSTSRSTRTLPFFVSFAWRCDGVGTFCLRTYQTGRLCARTLHYTYQTFKNYCMMDFVNCNEQHEVWQVVHMGECFRYKPYKEIQYYNYFSDSFLDEYYVFEKVEGLTAY